ncbi:MAG: hypothetical protein HFF33_07765 [Oscillospiraceae bacterium]|nr:hypothetical protein [Oscillospiraceae bacterium]
MKKRSWKQIKLAALTLTVFWLCAGAALAAGGGSQSDPLVTLSYLTQTVQPDILRQVEERANTRQADLMTQFEHRLDQLQGGTGGSAAYTLVTLSSGDRLELEVGCELMLRVGSAAVNSATEPALIDMTTGGTLANAGSLVQNHLYMATIPDRTVTASAGTVKLLVRGGYSIR